jgi:hypothetical protein
MAAIVDVAGVARLIVAIAISTCAGEFGSSM